MPSRPLAAPACALLLTTLACSNDGTVGGDRATAGVVHLASSLDEQRIVSAAAPFAAREQRRWSFHEEQPAWRPLDHAHTGFLATVDTVREDDALRVAVDRSPTPQTMLLIGGLWSELGDELRLGDWESVRIRARSNDRFAGMTVTHNLGAEGAVPTDLVFFFSTDEAPPVFNDGSVQTYAIPLRARDDEDVDTPLDSIGVVVAAIEPAEIDVLSIELVPRGAAFLDDHGVGHVVRDGETRTTLFAHTPAQAEWDLRVPDGGRLDLGLAVTPGDAVRYSVSVREGEAEPQLLFEEAVADATTWSQRSIDLAPFAGRDVTVILDADADRKGSVALWGAPIASGERAAELPNVIFYVIDGAGADFMSVYGYDRPTTPFLEQLAAEGTLFERAYSNSTWTQPSTVSFMTSLHHSVLGGLRRGVHSTPVPEGAVTMAEHFRAAGYQTASFGANPNAGRIIGIERGVDVLRDTGVEHHSTSSKDLHRYFWQFRDAYPGGPTWTHFQTTDVHEPNHPDDSVAGTFVPPGGEQQAREWEGQMFRTAGFLFGRTSIVDFYDVALERTGIDRHAYFDTRRGLYDETMLYQDALLARLVAELKTRGEWASTLLVIGADHGHPAGSFARWGRGLFDPQPEPWEGALFDAYSSRVPLLFVWPGEIEAGRRIAEPVSMIDVLPTLLELVGLPQPEVLQGQSLAPLLRGEAQQLRPVVLDEFRIDDATGEMVGNLEIVDGRWGASLEIGPAPAGAGEGMGRHAVPAGGRWGALHPVYPEVPRLLLYDLEADPFVRQAVNDEHPERVEAYRRQLLELWQAHQALAGRFTPGEEVELTPEQLRQLRSLGYIQ